MSHIQKIKLQNFKRFRNLETILNEDMNLIIGDNESGKSSILTAIDIVLSASRYKVETIGLDSLFNIEVINEFLGGDKRYDDLPRLSIELYLNDTGEERLNGNANSDGVICDGIKLECVPNDELSDIIKEILQQGEANFPFEFYSIEFSTFRGEIYTSHRKYLNHIFIDNSRINGEHAMREFVKIMYRANTTIPEQNQYSNEYRHRKELFKNEVLAELNTKLDQYSFTVRHSSKINLETDLGLEEENVRLEHKGSGRQSIIKTEFALSRRPENLDLILIEEPENHLSHLNMKKLIHGIQRAENKQIFITTHSDLVSSRLNLRKALYLNSNSQVIVRLEDLSEDTAKFFTKAPDNNILEFIMSRKVMLVEGDAEFMLMEAMFQNSTNQELTSTNVHVISVGGIRFERYLELAELLDIKTAVITDNDGNYQTKVVDKYSRYNNDVIRAFADPDNAQRTFEVCVFETNRGLCEQLFEVGRRTLTVQEYMLQNKADVAFEILDKASGELTTPNYIEEACRWINE